MNPYTLIPLLLVLLVIYLLLVLLMIYWGTLSPICINTKRLSTIELVQENVLNQLVADGIPFNEFEATEKIRQGLCRLDLIKRHPRSENYRQLFFFPLCFGPRWFILI